MRSDSKLLNTSSLTFGKGPKQPPPPTRVDDNLRSQDTVEVLIGLGEGPWDSLEDGMKSFFIADTPLMAADGTLNFPDANLIFHRGTQMPDPIKLTLGGSAQGVNVGVNLAQNAPVTRTTTSGDIDFIDVRLRIDQLYKTTDEGDFLNNDLLFSIRVKLTSDSTWTDLPPNTGWIQNFTSVNPFETESSGFFATIAERVGQLVQEEQLSEFDAQVQAWQEYQDNADGPIDTSLGFEGYSNNIRIYGATRSPVVKEIRIPVARVPSDTYDIQVTKISAESDSSNQREITWDTFEQITAGDVEYPNTAMAQLIVKATDQLSNIPPMYGIYKMSQIKVPTIFDPETRSYDYSGGPWDGSFKLAHTDDLAWIIYDLIHNDVHGIAAYYPLNFSKYEAEEASLYWNACNPVTGAYEGVPRPNGGTRPRVTFNGLIDSPRNSMELLVYLAGAGNAVFYEDVEGTFKLRVEKNEGYSQVFTNMDIDDKFQYSFTDTSTRYNDITVVYRNKKLPRYQEDRRRIFDQADIDLHGRKPLSFIAVGCVDTDEAMARAYHKLLTSLTETRIVTFKTTRLGMYVEPHDIIKIADVDMDEGVSRRAVGIDNNRRIITMNQPYEFPAGVTDHIFRTQTPNGVFQANVNESNTDTNTIILSTAVPTGLDENFSFSISSPSVNDMKDYRVLEVKEGDSGDESVTIAAIEVNPDKQTLVDNYDGTSFVGADPLVPHTSDAVRELTAAVTERITENGKVKDIELTWSTPEASVAGGTYAVRHTFNDQITTEVQRSSSQQYTLVDAQIGTHAFTVVPIKNGVDSPETRRARVVIAPPDYGLPSITGITIQNKKAVDTEYIGRNVTFEWSVDTSEKWKDWELGKPHPDFAYYEIDVVDNTSGAIVQTYQHTDWNSRTREITYAELVAFGLTDIRDYSVVVTISNAQGNEGASFSRQILKPAVTLQNVSFSGAIGTTPRGRMSYDIPDDSDFKGVNVWVGPATPAVTNTKVWSGEGTPVLDYVDGTNYIAYQPLDVFGAVGQAIIETSLNRTVTDTQQILDDLDAAIDDIIDDVDANTVDIADLTTTYGSTAAAAQSAAEALASRNAAALHEINSEAAKDLAETAATNAANSEIAASDASGVAVSTAMSLLPSTFENADRYFTHDTNGSPETVSDVSLSPNHTLITDAQEGDGIRTQVGHDYIAPKGYIPIIEGRTYEVHSRVKASTLPTNGANIRMGLRMLEADYSGAAYSGDAFTPTDTDAHDYVFTHTVTAANIASGARYARPEIFTNFVATGDGDGVFDTFELSVRDVTESVSAAGSASAAATHEFNAGVSATDAASEANAASIARTGAETARSGAESAETNAATSETNAGTSAANAASSETNAATSETNAGASATAASGSASTAASEASDAALSATAASSSETAAALSATDAEDSADASAISASNAAVSETNAGNSASAASLSETNAATSETNASTSEANAAVSETNADGSASAAAVSNTEVQAALELIAGGGGGYTPEPHLINTDRQAFTSSVSGLSQNNADLSSSIWPDVTDPTLGPAVQSNGADIIATKNNYVIDTNDEWTISLKYIAVTDNTGSPAYVRGFIRWLDNTGASLGAISIGNSPTYTVADGVQNQDFVVNMSSFSPPANATHIKFYFFSNISGGDGVNNWSEFLVDLTSAIGGGTGYVGAAAASAAAAAVSETNAGTFATASENSATNASTSASNAGTSETNAATSATNAASSETNAAASAATAVTAETNSANSASAAATSETNASASETAAGNSATASEQSRLASESAESNASVSELNAATSATDAAGSAASALQTLEVTSRSTTSTILNNPRFHLWDTNQTYPKGYTDWGTPSAGTVSRETSITKFGDSLKIVTDGTDEFGLQSNSTNAYQGVINVDPDAQYTEKMIIEAWVYLESGPRTGAGFLFSVRNSAGSTLKNEAVGLGSFTVPLGRWVHIQRLMTMTTAQAAAATDAFFYIMGDWDSFGANSAKTMYVAQASVRPASIMEIEADKVGALEASATVTQAAVTSLEDQLAEASVSLEAEVNGTTARVALIARNSSGVPYSRIINVADEIQLYSDTGGGILEGLRVSGGNVRISGDLEAGAGIYLGSGSGRWAVALQDQIYNEDDGAVISFGLDIGDYEVDFSTLGLDELNAGESYVLRAINKSGTGFTADLKITTTGTTTAVQEDDNATSPAGPDHMVDKHNANLSYNDSYTFFVSGSMDIQAINEGGPVEYFGGNFITTWFHDGTSWVEGPSQWLDYNTTGINPNHSSGSQSYPFTQAPLYVSWSGAVRTSTSLGCFGVSNGDLTDLNRVTYTTQGQSGTRSATPSGELCKITVKPINVVT